MDSISKKDVMAKLDELKIEYKSSQLKDELYALLPEDVRAKIESDAAAQAEADAKAKEEADAKEKAEAEAAANKSDPEALVVANVTDKDDRFIRAYSLAVHGEDFAKFANEFIASRDGFKVVLAKESAEVKNEAPTPEKGVTAEVRSKDSQVVRTFTKEIHGEDFEKLAHEFADPRSLSVVVV